MFGNHFYHESTRRYVAVFGTLFNDIEITRKDTSGNSLQKMKVPINYAPKEKILVRLDQDPNLNNKSAITLPRMSFEITGMSYSAERKLTSLTKQIKGSPLSDGSVKTMYTPAPYDIEFQLNVMSKYNEDGMKIIEQILPFFKPDCTVSVQMVDDMGYVDIPIVLSSVSQEDTYDGDFQTRRALIWTLNFTMKAYFFSPMQTKKQIKFIDVDVYPSMIQGDGGEQIEVMPTLGPIDPSGTTTGTTYRIVDLGSGTNIQNRTAWSVYLGTQTTNYKVGDTYQAPANVASNVPPGSSVSVDLSQIDENDDWKALTVISDGDGTI
jgi:5-hydroxyisourate hydrolase-like protein (transthyretin family)